MYYDFMIHWKGGNLHEVFFFISNVRTFKLPHCSEPPHWAVGHRPEFHVKLVGRPFITPISREISNRSLAIYNIYIRKKK